MPGVTDTQSLRFGYVTDPISYTMLRDLADDTATQLDAADVSRTAALKRPVVRVQRLAALAIPVAPTITTVTWDTEVWDTHNMVDLAGQPTRVTAVAAAGAGVYVVQPFMQGDTTSWTRMDMILSRTGVFYGQKTWRLPQAFGSWSATWIVNLPSVGDYVTLGFYHEGGGTTNTINLSMSVYKLSN